MQTVVAPNNLHHFYFQDFAEAYPDARVFATPPGGGSPKTEGDRIDKVLTGVASPLWDAELGQVALEGAERLTEVVFFHHASRSLIVTDLVFNIRVVFPTLGLTPREPRGMSAVERQIARFRSKLAAFGVHRVEMRRS